MDTDQEIGPLRQQILDLASEGKIKRKKATIMKASEETLENIYKEYELEQLDESLCQVADMVIKKYSELLEALDTIKDSSAMEKDLASNDLLRKDLKNVIGYVAPYIPMVGILSGGLTVGKHVITKLADDSADTAKATKVTETQV